MIRKVKGGFKIRTRKGKMLGRKGGKAFKTRKAAEKRERQISYWKNK